MLRFRTIYQPFPKSKCSVKFHKNTAYMSAEGQPDQSTSFPGFFPWLWRPQAREKTLGTRLLIRDTYEARLHLRNVVSLVSRIFLIPASWMRREILVTMIEYYWVILTQSFFANGSRGVSQKLRPKT